MKMMVVMLGVLTAMVSSAQDVRSAIEAEIAERDLAADEAWTAIGDAAALSDMRGRMRGELMAALGKMPERTPLNARVVAKEDCGAYRLEKIIYESRPGVYVTGILYLPDARKYAAPYPAWMFAPGHYDGGKAAESYIKAAMLGAINGYAVFMTDPVGQGEREQGAGVRNVEEHVRLGALATLLGQSQTGIMLWDLMRGVDYLESRKDIVADRIGSVGHSGGGTMSSFLGAIDGRIRAVAPSCYISSVREVIAACGPQDPEQNIFGQLKFGFNHLGLVMLNDRPWLLNLAREDFFPYAGSISTLKAAKKVVSATGGDESCYESISAAGGHAIEDEHRQGIVRWFDRHLRGDAARQVVTGGCDRVLSAADVQVTPNGSVRELAGFRSYYDCFADDLAELRRQRPLVAAERMAAAARLAGVRVAKRGGKATRAGSKPMVLVATIGDQSVAERIVAGERTKGRQAKAVRLFAADAAEWSKPKRTGKGSYYGGRCDDEEVAVELFLLGRTLVGERASELLEQAETIREQTGIRPDLIAAGRAAIVAAFACAADRAAFGEVRIVDPPCAWEDAVRRRALVSYADLVPGGLAVCDWPDLLPSERVSPLGTMWTFGNHEPVAMYRRIGWRSTGGIEGGARWLEDWHHWFDSRDCTTLMKSLGLNAIHSRFFKGMGWQAEKDDFEAVKGFVRNCHADGVTTLAYVQFLSLYYERFGKEVPNLIDWANRTATGEIGRYGDQYARWLPCITSPDFEEYLGRMAEIALKEGGFDGVMFDNLFVAPCYCERCERLFREWLGRNAEAPAHLGFEGYEAIRQPRTGNLSRYGEIQDPLMQLWIEWRVELLDGFFARMRARVKSVDPTALLVANSGAVRSRNSAKMLSRDMVTLGPSLDVVLGQNGNVPGLKDGMIVNRVRDLKFLRDCGVMDLALCDGDAGLEVGDESAYLLPLVEDAAFGGIPADRTVIKPCRTEGFVNREQLEFRRPLLKKFRAMLEENRERLSAPFHEPVRIFYSMRGVRYSETAYRGVFGAEETLLRRHVPFGYAISRPGVKLSAPEGCEVMVVADQRSLSDGEVEFLRGWARKGCRIVFAGECGGWDDWNRQRLNNPFDDLRSLPNVAFIPSIAAQLENNCEWEYRVRRAADGGESLVAALDKVGWKAPYALESLPETVFVETRRTDDGYVLFFVNYDLSQGKVRFRVNGSEGEFSGHAIVFVKK